LGTTLKPIPQDLFTRTVYGTIRGQGTAPTSILWTQQALEVLGAAAPFSPALAAYLVPTQRKKRDASLCLLQIVSVPTPEFAGEPTICCHEEWLEILRGTHDMMNLLQGLSHFPTPFSTAPAAYLVPTQRKKRDASLYLLQIVSVPTPEFAGEPKICYDEEWLAILRETHDMMNLSLGPTRFPSPFSAAPAAHPDHRKAVRSMLGLALKPIPEDLFTRTVDGTIRGQGTAPTSIPQNPQTLEVLRLIGRPWNLTREDALPQRGALTGDDLLGDDGMFSGADDPMFEPVEIHNFDPFAYLDTKDQNKRRKLSEMLSEADAKAKSAGLAGTSNPEEIDIGSDMEEGHASAGTGGFVGNGSQDIKGNPDSAGGGVSGAQAANLEEISIGTDDEMPGADMGAKQGEPASGSVVAKGAIQAQ
jgi:hypothetical protein